MFVRVNFHHSGYLSVTPSDNLFEGCRAVPPTLFLSVGEHSGDLLGAELVKAFQVYAPHVKCFGVVGQQMKTLGVEEIAHIDELGMMGFWEVLSQIGSLSILEKRVTASWDLYQPTLAVLIDFPGLHFRFAESLRLRRVPVVQYVAPKVWAWGRHRCAALRRDFAWVLGILPFEASVFKQEQVPYRYVGSPHWDRLKPWMEDHPKPIPVKGKKQIAFLPGSRLSELDYHLPVMFAIKQLLDREGDLSWHMPVAENLSVEVLFHRFPELRRQVNCGLLHLYQGHSLEVMRRAWAGLIASGTATLECALAETPMVVVYVMSPLTYRVAQRKVHLPYYSLVNLVLEAPVVAEFIQQVRPEEVALTLRTLIEDTPERTAMLQEFKRLPLLLAPRAVEKSAPTDSVAEGIAQMLIHRFFPDLPLPLSAPRVSLTPPQPLRQSSPIGQLVRSTLWSESMYVGLGILGLVVMGLGQSGLILMFGPLWKILFHLVPQGTPWVHGYEVWGEQPWLSSFVWFQSLQQMRISTSWLLWCLPVGLFVCGGGRSLGTYLYQNSAGALNLALARAYRNRLFKAIVSLPYGELIKKSPATWMAHLMGDVQFLEARFSDLLNSCLRDGLTLVSGFLALAVIRPSLALAFISLVPGVAWFMGHMG